jgi:hypothetical protein
MGRYAEKVNLGVEWLNEQNPEWRSQVNKSRLNMRSAIDCVLGQLYGTFWNKVLGTWEPFSPDKMLLSRAIDLGFSLGSACTCHELCDYNDCPTAYAELTHDWNEVL